MSNLKGETGAKIEPKFVVKLINLQRIQGSNAVQRKKWEVGGQPGFRDGFGCV